MSDEPVAGNFDTIDGDPASHQSMGSATPEGGDGVDRRGFLKCMAWAGTGLIWTLSAGVLSSATLAEASTGEAAAARGDFSFVQLSDSHIGFNKEPNQDVIGTFQQAVNHVKALKQAPAFVLHTGDISHLSKPAEFDAVQQILAGAKLGEVFYIPGEHDTFVDNGAEFLKRYRKPGDTNGWQSFDFKGVHFVGLVNV